MAHALIAWLPSVSQHLLFGALAVLVYILSNRARRQPRAPTTAIAWVMGLALLPYFVLPLFLLFGRRKLRPLGRPRLRGSSPTRFTHWAADLLDGFELAPPSANRARLHAGGGEAREALWELIAGARHRLDISTFIIGRDSFGDAVVERLAERAQAGVRVRVLLDGFGALQLPRRHFDRLRAAGGEVAVFRPLLSLRNNGPRNLRNHRKLAIADDQRLWSGGRNLAAEYFEGDAATVAWTDLSFDIEGPVASAAAWQFERDWSAVRQSPPRTVVPATPVPDGAPMQFLPSGPDQADDTAHALLIDACYRAEHRILAATPYFIPDDGLRDALRRAARRGVAVDIVLPAVSNHRLADFARSRAMRDLAEAGVAFHLLPAMSHAKAVVVDQQLALGGSINLDLRSLLLNHEAGVVFYGATQIRWLAQWIEGQRALGTVYQPQAPGLARDIAEGLLLAVAFQL
ncbi:phospholipase D-like domain-containing protein [Pseudorhodoferax sp.]|uniref:phospholipase D-like domain-containing protein n=1 Tax=Pseudorhodoferax sp. TaxID=1993553 RepID=UPI002DD6B03C|nr:phospholipase D-like domain-containing protein [Pseudorhodoferax sp.]